MENQFTKRKLALAVIAAIGTTTLVTAPMMATAAAKTAGTYVAGDFHNHTTCSDGSISMQKLVKKATDKTDTPWGLDWFVQAGHGGNGVVRWLHEYAKEFGGPSGADGGRGGDVIVRAIADTFYLRKYAHKTEFFAPDGEFGSGNSCDGAGGDDRT